MLAQEETLALDPAAAWALAGLAAVLLLVVGRELRQVPGKLLVLMAAAFLDVVGHEALGDRGEGHAPP